VAHARLQCRLIDALVRVAKQQGCYKVILDCTEHNVLFYEKCGLSRKEVQMVGGIALRVWTA
jgi:glucosamine-phosphate N-acetyltransferase